MEARRVSEGAPLGAPRVRNALAKQERQAALRRSRVGRPEGQLAFNSPTRNNDGVMHQGKGTAERRPPAMQIIGLLGGVASGKSFVAEQFRRLGALVLNADQMGHEVLLQPEIRMAIRNHFGEKVFGEDGQVDRKALGRIVFGSSPDGPRELELLERITHPKIRERLVAQVERMAADGVPAAILDAPVMLKSGWDEICTAVVFIEAPEDMRRRRALARGWTSDEFAAREASQESLEVKRRRSDFVIDNSGRAEYTQAQIERLWQSLVG